MLVPASNRGFKHFKRPLKAHLIV